LSAFLCHCTCPDADSAERISQALSGERLAACVGVLPGVRSTCRNSPTRSEG